MGGLQASSTGQTSGHLQERLNCAFKGVGIKFCRQEGQHSFVTPLVRTGEVLEEAGQRGSGEDFWDSSRMSVSHIPKKTEDEFSRCPSLWGFFCYWSRPNLTRSNRFHLILHDVKNKNRHLPKNATDSKVNTSTGMHTQLVFFGRADTTWNKHSKHVNFIKNKQKKTYIPASNFLHIDDLAS